MITYILLVANEKSLDSIIKTLEGNIPDMRMPWNILCLTNNKELYPKIRNRIQEVVDDMPQDYRRECLTEYVSELDYTQAIPLIRGVPDKSMIILNDFDALPRNAVSKMIYELTYKPYAGFICFRTEHSLEYKVDNIYSKSPQLMPTKDQEIDTATPYGVLLKASTFREIAEQFKGSCWLFGIELRKKGYTNYCVKEVKSA